MPHTKMIDELKPLQIKLVELYERLRYKVHAMGEHKFVIHWIWVVAIWLCTWITLINISQTSRAVAWISIGLLAVHVTTWINQAIRTITPKTFISNTKDKAVVITGCDTGFGHHLAVKLDKLGFKVFAGCLFPDGEGAKQLREETSDRLQILKIDVTDGQTIKEAYKIVKTYLEESKYRLWALVNNAGIAAVTEIEWCPMEVYKKIFDVNSIGLLRVTKTFLPLVRQDEGNRIIIVASLAGRYTFPGFSAYSMSKHAAVSFADALRQEMRKWNVSVHTVEPTLYKTPIADNLHILSSLDKIWAECPAEIRKSYGDEYLEDFKTTVTHHMMRAKPSEKIHEVIDDMVHAVAGEEPRCRYVPSFQTQFHDQVLSSLPIDVLDNLFSKNQPQTPPADVEGMKKIRFRF